MDLRSAAADFPRFGDGGGPVIWKGTDKTFFFGDYLRWTDRQIGTANTLNGAPTAAAERLFSNSSQSSAGSGTPCLCSGGNL